MPGAAARTCPVPGRELQFGEQVTAGRAGLAGGEPAVDHDQRAAGAFALVFQLPSELAPASVGYGAGEVSPADHAGDVEIFDHNNIGRPHQRCARAVQEVLPGVAHLAMSTGDLGLCSVAVAAATLATGQSALVPGQVSCFAGQMSRVGNAYAVAGHQEVLQPKIHLDRVSRRQSTVTCDVHGEARVPATVRFARDHDHGRIQFANVDIVEGPREPKWRTGLGQRERSVTHPERRSRVVRGLAARPRFEPRMPGASGEEVLEWRVLVAQRLLQRYAGHLRKKREFFSSPPPRQGGTRVPVRGGRVFAAVSASPLVQRLVPHQSHTPEGAAEHRSLFGSRTGPAFVRRSHDRQRTGTEMTSWMRALVRRAS